MLIGSKRGDISLDIIYSFAIICIFLLSNYYTNNRNIKNLINLSIELD